MSMNKCRPYTLLKCEITLSRSYNIGKTNISLKFGMRVRINDEEIERFNSSTETVFLHFQRHMISAMLVMLFAE